MGMPTYEYLCTSCGNRIEVFRRIDEDSLTICDVCGGALRKVFHPAGIVFKGSGFYATDSRAASKRSADSTGDKTEKKDGDAGTKKEPKKKDEAKKKGDTSTSKEKAG